MAGSKGGKTRDVEDAVDVKQEGDVVQSAMGVFGRWQIVICIWISLMKMPVAFHQLSIVFLAPPVDFWCSGDEAHTPDSCMRAASNQSELMVPCESWEYNRTVFTETIITQWDLVCDRKQLANVAQMIFMFGVLLGNVFFGMAADRFGRKMPLIIAVVLQLVSGVATAFVPWFEGFMVTRFLLALATGGTMITSFVICMEIVGGKWRTIVAVLYHVPFSIGHSLLGIIAIYVRDWHLFQLIISLPSIVLLAYWWTIPESPRWLLATGRHEQAVKVLKEAAATNKLGIKDMKQRLGSALNEKTPEEQGSPGNILDLFRTPNMRTKTLCLYFNWIVCGLCFFGLAQYMGRVGSNIFLNVGLSGLIEMPGGLVGMYLMTKIGRRYTLAMSQMLAAIACLLIMCVPEDVEWARISLAALGIVGMSISFPTIYLFSGELFPTVVRNVGVGSSSMCARIGSMAAPFVASLSGVSFYLPPLCFGLMPLVGSLLCFLLPETLNSELPETLLDGENFGKKKKKPVENGTSNFGYINDEAHM